MYRCTKCGQEFTTFEEFIVHRVDEQGEESRRMTEQMIAQLRGALAQSAAVSIAQAIIRSRKAPSVDEALSIYREVTRKLMETGLF